MEKLNFGCGFDKLEGYDNVDAKDFDFNVFPYPLEDNAYDEILVKNVIEHLDYPWKVLRELHRICKPLGKITIISAHHNCESAYSSLQHKTFFNEQAFNEFVIRNPIFDIVELKVKPTILGRMFPSRIRDILARHIGHLKGEITCVYEKI